MDSIIKHVRIPYCALFEPHIVTIFESTYRISNVETRLKLMKLLKFWESPKPLFSLTILEQCKLSVIHQQHEHPRIERNGNGATHVPQTQFEFDHYSRKRPLEQSIYPSPIQQFHPPTLVGLAQHPPHVRQHDFQQHHFQPEHQHHNHNQQPHHVFNHPHHQHHQPGTIVSYAPAQCTDGADKRMRLDVQHTEPPTGMMPLPNHLPPAAPQMLYLSLPHHSPPPALHYHSSPPAQENHLLPPATVPFYMTHTTPTVSSVPHYSHPGVQQLPTPSVNVLNQTWLAPQLLASRPPPPPPPPPTTSPTIATASVVRNTSHVTRPPTRHKHPPPIYISPGTVKTKGPTTTASTTYTNGNVNGIAPPVSAHKINNTTDGVSSSSADHGLTSKPTAFTVSFDDPDFLRKRHDSVIASLYGGDSATTITCKTCGMRQPDQKTMGRHLDWHFRTNMRDGRHLKQSMTRSWFEMADDWSINEGSVQPRLTQPPGLTPDVSTIDPSRIDNTNLYIVPAQDDQKNCIVSFKPRLFLCACLSYLYLSA